MRQPRSWSPEPRPLHNWRHEFDQVEDYDDQVLKVRPSELAKKLVVLRDGGGMPFTTERRPYLLPIYDHWHKRMVVIGGRQIEKSTMLSNLMLMPAVAERGYRTLLVNPTDTHTKTFAYDKLEGTINASPYLQEALGKPRIDNLAHKEFANGSSILLRSAYLTARSARGIPADQLLIDEGQDMIPDHLPVLAETLTHSHMEDFGRRIVIAGTALTPECMIGEFWEDHSTQGEWVIKCKNNHDNVLEVENLTDKGLVCSTCGDFLDPQNGRWVHMFPERQKQGLYVGYRIPQVINPMVFDHWDDIAIKLRTYSNARIHQEVLGRSYDAGERPVSMAELRRAEEMEYPMSTGPEHVELTVMGVDWGYGDMSYTVVTVGGWNYRDKFQIIYSKRYKMGEETHPEYQLQDILRLRALFGCPFIGVDYGAGWGQNARLRAKFPNVQEFIYSHGQKSMIKYSPAIHRYTVNRTESMSGLFTAFKVGRMETFKGYSEEFGVDYLNVSGTVDSLGRVLYTHSPSRPDDAVHSANYCFLMGRIMKKELNPAREEEPKRGQRKPRPT